MDELYEFIEDRINLTNSIEKIERLESNVERVVNPLGLTGFEFN